MGQNNSTQANNDSPSYPPFAANENQGGGLYPFDVADNKEQPQQNAATPASPENTAVWPVTDANLTPSSPLSPVNTLNFYESIKELSESVSAANAAAEPIAFELEETSSASSDSPFITQKEYNDIMQGGRKKKRKDSSTSLESLESISISSSSGKLRPSSSLKPLVTVSSSTVNVEANSNSASEYNVKMYGFSETSSELIKTSDNNYVTKQSSQTPYKVDSSSVNTSDIKLVSESISSASGKRGQRFLH